MQFEVRDKPGGTGTALWPMATWWGWKTPTGAGWNFGRVTPGRAGDPGIRLWCRNVALAVLSLAAVTVGLDFMLTRFSQPAARLQPYWWALPLMLAGATLLWRLHRPGATWWRWCGMALLIGDAFFQGFPLARVRDEAAVYASSPSVQYLATHAGDRTRTLDADLGNEATSPLGPAQPFLRRIQVVRGYNSFDLLRFKEYLGLVAGTGLGDLKDTGFRRLHVANQPLLDLFGVRYLLEPLGVAAPGGGASSPGWTRVLSDPRPVAYVFTGRGLVTVPPYELYENLAVLPRAFVVGSAAPLPPSPDAAALAMKSNDFRRRVLLEDMDRATGELPRAVPETGDPGAFRPAQFRSYEPNRVAIEASGDPPGWLVLTDVWFPGWQATVDGEPAPVFRANYLFRAVRLGVGPHEVVFTYRPRSYQVGRTVSLAALALVCLLGALLGWRRNLAT